MKALCLLLFGCLLFQACTEEPTISSISPTNWDSRTVATNLPDSLIQGTTYLSVYSQIYSQTEHKTHNLTATVSLRNTDRRDTIYLQRADYFDTKGNAIRTYFDQAIYIAPMETVEIVIDELDKSGGTGANFLFDWKVKSGSNEPLFEAIMISTSGQQGLSFTSQGVKIK
ncbi:MAG: DUF3124 domain-containing protein [Bacteroidota bacterium]